MIMLISGIVCLIGVILLVTDFVPFFISAPLMMISFIMFELSSAKDAFAKGNSAIGYRRLIIGIAAIVLSIFFGVMTLLLWEN